VGNASFPNSTAAGTIPEPGAGHINDLKADALIAKFCDLEMNASKLLAAPIGLGDDPCFLLRAPRPPPSTI